MEKKSTVFVEIQCTDRKFSVTVANKVKNICNSDLEKMFRRLWRKDIARTDGSHSGLRLALAKIYCDELGYEIRNDLSDEILTMHLSGPLLIGEHK